MSKWQRVAALAGRQWGVVSARQLKALGLGAGAIAHQTSTGRLVRLHQGVYAVGHSALRIEGRWIAAVLACGDGAVLSHRSAGALWGFRPTSSALVDVTTLRGGRHREGLRAHRTRGLAPEDTAMEGGIPTTSVPRTLLDLAATTTLGDLEAALARAQQMGLAGADAIERVLAHSRGHRGRRRLARVAAGDPKITREGLERRFLELIRRAGLPEPEIDVPFTLGGGEDWRLDALWRRQRVTVELDDWATHRTRRRFERDRERAAKLTAAGYRHLQLTWRQVTDEAPWVMATLATLLGPSGRQDR